MPGTRVTYHSGHAHLRARAWGGVSVVGGNPGARRKDAVGPLLRGTPMRRRAEGQGRRGKDWIMGTPAKGAGPGGSRSAERGDLLSDCERGQDSSVQEFVMMTRNH